MRESEREKAGESERIGEVKELKLLYFVSMWHLAVAHVTPLYFHPYLFFEPPSCD